MRGRLLVFWRAASLPEELAAGCAERGMAAMALLDRDGVYGAPRFYLAAKKISVAGAYWGGSDVCGRVAFSFAGGSARGLSKFCRLITR